MSEKELLYLILQGEKNLYEVIMRKYNQRLYRIARAIMKDESEIEDILQDTYMKAYEALAGFGHRSQFSTWLIRILINNANARLRKKKRFDSLSDMESLENTMETLPGNATEDYVSNKELTKILENAIDHLPHNLRSVYIMREIEGLSVSETSQCLDLSEENVKTRLHRAKAMLKEELYRKTKGDIDVFRFGLERCDRIVMYVMLSIRDLN